MKLFRMPAHDPVYVRLAPRVKLSPTQSELRREIFPRGTKGARGNRVGLETEDLVALGLIRQRNGGAMWNPAPENFSNSNETMCTR